MKFVVIGFVVTSCLVAVNAQFSKNLENLNVDMILKNDRILSNYLKCLLDKGEITLDLRKSSAYQAISISRSMHKWRSRTEDDFAANAENRLHKMLG